MIKTILNEEVDLMAETDALYVQLIHILHNEPAFESALTRGGELDAAAKGAIAKAFDEVFERNRRLMNIFLADKEAFNAFAGFWFARSYAEVQANKAYNDAFRRARKAT